MKHIDAYHYAVFAAGFIHSGGVGLTLILRTTLLVGVVEDLEVVVINVISEKSISDKFQDRGLSDTRLPDEKDGVWLVRLVL